MNEVHKYIPNIVEKSGIGRGFIEYALSLLPIQPYPEGFYRDSLEKAEGLIGETDRKGTNILALV